VSDSTASWERDFAAYADGRGTALRATAYLLCGDWHAAEDLTQTVLTKLYLAWRRIDRTGSVDAYARRVLLRSFLDERRRPWRRERPAAEPPDRAVTADGPRAVDERLALEAALRRLPRTQRAAVVLRYWCDLDIRETAATLGVSEGTVKSASSRGLAALREVLQGSRPQPAPTREGIP
jgi:RNA polymerase sigma-70 factor (sigma-E family)